MNKNVLITGVKGGIGTSLARQFKAAGWNIIGVDIQGDTHKYCDLYINADISRADAVQSMFQDIKKQFNTIHCIINNAALQIEKNLLETTEEEWDSVFRVNVYSIFHIIKYFINLIHNGSVINISSVHSRATSKGLAAYAASKGSVSSLTRVMALELADYNIRVNAILPGATQTPMLDKSIERKENHEEARKNLIEKTPLKRIGSPEDISNLALFLADNSLSRNVTGQEFVCDGGVLARLATE